MKTCIPKAAKTKQPNPPNLRKAPSHKSHDNQWVGEWMDGWMDVFVWRVFYLFLDHPICNVNVNVNVNFSAISNVECVFLFSGRLTLLGFEVYFLVVI